MSAGEAVLRSPAAAAPAPERRASAAELAGEERLVRSAAAGDREAFLAIYDRFAGPLFGYAVSRLGGDRSRAEDLVQEVFVALVRTGARYRARAPLRALLFRIAHNRVANAWRDARPEVEIGERASPPPRLDDVLAVRQALDRVPEPFREALRLSAWEQLSYEEIAGALGCPVGTVRSRVSRAKRLLAEKLGGGRP